MRYFAFRSSWSIMDKIAGAISLLLLAVVIFRQELGELDGRLFPAASRMHLTSAVELDGRTVFSGESARLRPGCNPKRLEWFLGDRGSQRTPIPVNWGKPEKRPNGAFSFEGWVADIAPPDVFVGFTHADVIHECRVFYRMEGGEAVGGFYVPWETRSPFWR